MKEATRTLIYAVTAAVAVGGASLTHYWTRPVAVAGFELVGEDFFPDFEDPTLAKSLRVVAYDEDTASISEFEVKQDESGHWTIPSRNDYPADAEDRLAKTAASIIGIKRGALASRYAADYEKYGVIEPDETDEQKLKGRGQRVTLQDGEGNKLVDYIIGKAVDNPEGHYYVRVPGEKETYISKFEVDLSTKFTDWIEDDLLKVDQSDLVEVKVDNYSIDEQQGAILGEETNILKKDGTDWKLDGLKEDTEELKTAEINTMISTLDNLKIVGVRPKPEGLNADLTVSPNARVDVNRLAAEMAGRGFIIARKRDGDGAQIYANEGELTASTSQGVSYTLRFGEIFTGSQSEIEGFSGPTKASPKKESKKEPKADDSPGDDTNDGDKDAADKDDTLASDSDSKSSRYVFISAAFDEKFLERPVKPTEPPTFDADAKDADAKDADAKDADAKDADAKDADAKDADAKDADAKDADAKDADAKDADAKDADAKDADAKDADADDKGEKADGPDDKKKEGSDAAAREAYEAQVRKYESDLKRYESKVEEGKKLAKELNARFAKWYYVISAESFEKLRLSRAALVKPKEKTEDQDKADNDEAAKDKPDGDDADDAGKDAPGTGAAVKKDGGDGKAKPKADKTPAVDEAKPKPTDDAPKADQPGAADKSEAKGADGSKGKTDKASDSPNREPAKGSDDAESVESKPDTKPAEPKSDPPPSEPKP